MASSNSNPFKDDAKVKRRLDEVDNVKTRKEFNRWKTSFLDTFESYLDPKSTKNADASFKQFSKNLSGLLGPVELMKKLIVSGDMSSDKLTVKAKQCLGEFKDKVTKVYDGIETIIPGTIAMEKRVGYSKFHLGAVLIRDGFSEYNRMCLCRDILQNKCRKVLEQFADRQILEAIDIFTDRLNKFCDVMADLGLYSVMKKSLEIARTAGDEKDEKPKEMAKSKVITPSSPAGNPKKSFEVSMLTPGRKVKRFGAKKKQAESSGSKSDSSSDSSSSSSSGDGKLKTSGIAKLSLSNPNLNYSDYYHGDPNSWQISSKNKDDDAKPTRAPTRSKSSPLEKAPSTRKAGTQKSPKRDPSKTRSTAPDSPLKSPKSAASTFPQQRSPTVKKTSLPKKTPLASPRSKPEAAPHSPNPRPSDRRKSAAGATGGRDDASAPPTSKAPSAPKSAPPSRKNPEGEGTAATKNRGGKKGPADGVPPKEKPFESDFCPCCGKTW